MVADLNPSTLSRWALETRAGDPLVMERVDCAVCGEPTAPGPGLSAVCGGCVPYLASIARARALMVEAVKSRRTVGGSNWNDGAALRIGAAIAECEMVLGAFRGNGEDGRPAQPELPESYHPVTGEVCQTGPTDSFLADLDAQERRERAAETGTPAMQAQAKADADRAESKAAKKAAKKATAKLPPPRTVGGPEHAPKGAPKKATAKKAGKRGGGK